MRSPLTWSAAVSLPFVCICFGLLLLSWRQTPDQKRNLNDATWNLSEAMFNFGKVSAALANPDSGLPATLAALNAKHGGIADTLRHIDIVSVQAARTSSIAHDATIAEKADIHNLSLSMQAFLDNADANVNGKGGLIPSATASIQQTGSAVNDLADSGKRLIAAATDNMVEVGSAFRNPDIAASLKSINLLTANAADAMNHVDGSTVNLELTTGYIKDYAHDLLNPKKLSLWGVVAATVAGHAAGPVAGAIVTHFLPTSITIKDGVRVKQ